MNPVTEGLQFGRHVIRGKLGLAAWATCTPLRTATEPFFKLLSEPKLLTLYDGGHVPSLEVLMSTTMPWLEEQLGRVGR